MIKLYETHIVKSYMAFQFNLQHLTCDGIEKSNQGKLKIKDKYDHIRLNSGKYRYIKLTRG